MADLCHMASAGKVLHRSTFVPSIGKQKAVVAGIPTLNRTHEATYQHLFSPCMTRVMLTKDVPSYYWLEVC